MILLMHQLFLVGLIQELQIIHQVSVMCQGHIGAIGGHPKHRLGVLPGNTAGRGITSMPNGHVAAKRVEGLLIKDLRDQAQILVHHDLLPITDGNASSLLSPVL